MYPTATAHTSGQALRGNGGAANQAMPAGAIERSTVQSTLDEQERTLSDLHTAISELESRLTAVLGPQVPQPSDASAPPSWHTVMQRADQHNHAIRLARQRLNDLMIRLEL